MRCVSFVLGVMASCVFAPGALFAQSVPVNDVCSHATHIGQPLGNSNLTELENQNNILAGTEGANSCVPFAQRDVFYTYTARCTETYEILVRPEGAFDPVVSVHTACPATTANQIACNDDTAPGNAASLASVTLHAGSTYVVRVSGFGTSVGVFTIQVRYGQDTYPRVACEITRDNLPALAPGSFPFSTCGAIDGYYDVAARETLCDFAGNNRIGQCLYYFFHSSEFGTLEVNTFGSDFDTRVALYAACPPPHPNAPPPLRTQTDNTAIGCNDDDAGTLQSRVIIGTNPNQDYVIRVGGYINTAGIVSRGQGVLNINYTPAATGCDSIDFNNDGVSPDSLDIDDYISVFAGGPCSNDPNCNDIDFNNDSVSPDSLDIDTLLVVFAGGAC